MPRILNMLNEPKLWRFLGPTSSIAGLVTYAHSKTFQYLFGNWDFFRAYLYIMVCFIVLGVTLFANKLRLSSHFLLKAHLEFLVLMITSLYSFYHDKVCIHSDILTLFAFAAFSLMLLSLSRQINHGFVHDLFSFFLGSFSVQFMKKERILILGAAAFCYSVILLRCYSHSQLQSRSVEAEKPVLEYPHENGELIGAESADNSRIEQLYKILQIEKLEKDFAGFEKECCWVYSSWRRQILEERLSNMEIKKFNIVEIQGMPWNDVQDKIERWIEASNSFLRILFHNERRLCDGFLARLSRTMDQTLMEVCQASVIKLLDFANAIAIGSRSTERLFKIIDMFETLRSLIPEFETLFSDQYCVVLKDEAIKTLTRLREAIKGIFLDLEQMIGRDSQNEPKNPEDADQITKHVMNYLDASCKYWPTLEHIFEESELLQIDHPKPNDEISPSSSLYAQMARIMEVLEINLEAKSKIYKDSASCSVFMMNNWKYIVQKSADNNLRTLLGDDWIGKQTEKVQRYQGLLNPENVASESKAVAKFSDRKFKMPKIPSISQGRLLVKGLKKKIRDHLD